MNHLLFASALALVGSAAWASSDLQACARIEDRDRRLACYDALAARSAAQPAKSQAPVAAAPAAAVAAQVPAPDSSFGLPRSSATKAQEIRTSFNGLLEGWDSKTVFVLANGQHWRVADGSSAYLNLQSPQILIREAALGGYMMEVSGSNKVVRVRRVR